MQSWKLEKIDRVPMRPDRLAIILKAHEPWIGAAMRRVREMVEERFVAALPNCVELAAYRSREGQDKEMRDTLARVELELREVDVAMAVAKADLRGEKLARKLADLERKRTAAEARVPDLKEGIRLFIVEVDRDREVARAALVRLSIVVGKDVFLTAKGEMDQAKAALVDAIAPHLKIIAELMQAAMTPMHGAYGSLADHVLNGTLPRVETPTPPEAAAPTAPETAVPTAAPEAAVPTAPETAVPTAGKTEKSFRLALEAPGDQASDKSAVAVGAECG